MRCCSITLRSSDVCTLSCSYSFGGNDDQCLPLSSSLCDPRAVSEDAFANHLRVDSHPALGRLKPSRSVLVIVAAFLIALLGSLPLLSRYHFDEGWYTNAAIEMVRTGDYLTPRYADGSARFRKPIVTYWVLAGTYATMGIGLVASRLPFLLAGGVVLWVTYRIGRSTTGDSHTGVAATAILASNIEFMESATKSTPDMLQCLFLTLSIWGAVEIMFQQRRESRWYALLYVGAGLAIATKGFLAVILLLFVWGCARFVPMTNSGARRIMHWGWLGAGVVIALSWFIGLLLFQGSSAISTMFEDQIGERLEGAQTFVLTNVLLYVLTPLRFFAPWIVLLTIAVMTQRDLVVQYIRLRKPLVWFVLGWFLANVILFSLGNLMRSRYLLPTYPLLAVLLADMLMLSLRTSTFHAVTRTIRSVMLAALGLGLFVAAIGGRLDLQVLLGGVLFAGVTGLLYIAAFRRIALPALVALSLTVIAAFATLEQFIKPVIITSPARDITHRLLELQPIPQPIAAIDVRPSLVNQIRLLSGGRVVLQEIRIKTDPYTLRQFPLVLGSERVRQTLGDSAQRDIEECGATYAPPTIAAIWAWLITGDRESLTNTERTSYYLIKRRTGEIWISKKA